MQELNKNKEKMKLKRKYYSLRKKNEMDVKNFQNYLSNKFKKKGKNSN